MATFEILIKCFH